MVLKIDSLEQHDHFCTVAIGVAHENLCGHVGK